MRDIVIYLCVFTLVVLCSGSFLPHLSPDSTVSIDPLTEVSTLVFVCEDDSFNIDSLLEIYPAVMSLDSASYANLLEIK